MIEEIALPLNTRPSGGVAFPMCNDISHSHLGREADERVQMIRHEQQNVDEPFAGMHIKPGGVEDDGGCVVVAELVHSPLSTANGDEKYFLRWIDEERGIMR